MTKYLNSEDAKKYSLSGIENTTYYLAYRDIPALLKKHAKGVRALDYGCGTGRSTRFLKDLNFETIGVDTSKEMLQQALEIDAKNHYLLIENGKIPVLDSSCDIILACLVLCTIQTKQELLVMLQEIHRCLSDNGVFIAVTASDIFYNHQWFSYKTDYEENRNLQSGTKKRFYLKDLHIELTNFYWTHVDNCKLFKASGLEVVERLNPLGNIEDSTSWISEINYSPYFVYVLKKTKCSMSSL